MKKIICSLCVYVVCGLTFLNPSFCQAPEWTRMLQTGTYGFPGLDYVTADANFNYMAASIAGPVTFDGVGYSCVGNRDMIIEKVGNGGSPAWIKQINAQAGGLIYANAIKADASGNVYVAGTFSGTTTIGSNTITSSALYNAFLAKFDQNGNGLWATPFLYSGTGYSKIAIDASGNVYLLSKSTKVIKFNTTGTIQWEQSYPDKTLQAIAVYGSNLYIGGALQTTTTFGTIVLTTLGGYNTGYLVKADLNGIYTGSTIVGGSTTGDGSSVSDITMDAVGNLIITGGYTKNLILGTINITNATTLYYTYIAKCDNNFTFAWARSSSLFSNPLREMFTYRIFTDNSNNIYEYGLVTYPFTYGTVNVNQTSGQFLVKFDATGNPTGSYTLQNSTVNKTFVSPSGRIPAGGSYGIGTTTYGNFFLTLYDNSMVQIWQKASSYSLAGTVSINYIKHDASGNTYLQSRISGYCNYFGRTISTTNYVTVISKHDVSGNLLWMNQVSDINTDLFGCAFTLDKDNNVVTIGLFQTTLTIGSVTLTSSNTGYEGYVAKYGSNGEFLWASKLNLGISLTNKLTVATDNARNVIVSGMNNPSNFIVKFNSAGNKLWDKSFAMESYYISLVSTDAGNNIFMASEIHLSGGSGSATIGSVVLTQTNSDGATALIKFDPDGNALWAKTYGGVTGASSSDGWPCDIRNDEAGNTYLWGWCNNNARFGTYTLVNPISPNQNYSYYLTKINSSGDVVWAKAVYETKFSFNYGDLLDLDLNGNIYAGGHFNAKINIDGNEFIPEGTNDFFAVKYSNDGAFQWIKTIPANGTIVNAFSANDNNTLSVSGIAGKNPVLGSFVIDRKSGSSVTVSTMGTLKYLDVSSHLVTFNGPAGGSKTITVSSNTSWTISSSQPWLTLNMSNGSGDATITLTAGMNGSSASRAAEVTISRGNSVAQKVTVSQIGTAVTSFPYIQNFSTWPPDSWDFTGGTFSWQQYNSGSAYADFWNNEAPNVAYMTTPILNFTGLTNPQIDFKWSHKYYAGYQDNLKIEASTDGLIWTTVWDKKGTELNSNDGAADQAPGTFVTASINLKTYAGQPFVKIRFNGISDYGPNIYIDDVTVFNATVSTPVAVTNPVTSEATLSGIVTANNSSTVVTFEYGLTTSYGLTVNATPGTVNGDAPVFVIALLNDLSVGATYHYRVKAVSSAGTAYGSDVTFTPKGAATVNFLPETYLGTYADLGAKGSAIVVPGSKDGKTVSGAKSGIITTPDFDNANSAPQDIGFTFRFNSQDFTQFILNTNGFIKLGAVPPSSAALFFSGANTYNGVFSSADPLDVNIISPFTTDLTAGTLPAEYRVSTTGSAPDRVCIIQYKNVRDKTVSPPQQYDNMNFQIKLYETSNIIEFVYGSWTPSANATGAKSAECGIKGSNNSNNHLITVYKSSTASWNAAAFQHTNYTANAFNFGNPPDRPVPDVGRTYRFVPMKENDAAVVQVYSLTKLPLLAVNQHIVKAVVKNVGINTLTDILVTLTISGANSFTSNVTVPVLYPNTNTVVTFDAFTPVNTGTNTVNVTVQNDDSNSNNSYLLNQVVNNAIFSYSDGSPATSAVGQGGLSLSRFYMDGKNLINGVNVLIADYSTNVGNTVYAVVLNKSGTLIGRSANYVLQNSDLGTMHSFAISVPPLITDEYFFVGLAGTNPIGSTYYPVAMQNEIPQRTDTYFYSSLIGGSLYLRTGDFRYVIEAVVAVPDLSVSPGSLLVEAAAGSSKTFDILTNASWTAVSDQSWLVLNKYSGAANSTVTVAAAENTGTTNRYATVTVSVPGLPSQQISVTQSGLTTALNDLDKPLGLTIYPNPNNGKFYVRMNNISGGDLRLLVINYLGMQIKDIELTDQDEYIDHEIDLGSVSKGIYFIHLQSGKRKTVKTFIIK